MSRSQNNYNKNNGTRVYDKQHNPIVTVANNFNTLVCYDSKTDHGPTSIDNEERLTIVIFLMSKFNFDDTETSGIWWSTNVSIRDICLELKDDTKCDDGEIVELLRSIANNIEKNGL